MGFSFQTDHKTEHNRPDIVAIDKKERNCTIINITCPFDHGVSRKKKKEEIEKYQDLKRQLKGLWNYKEVVPLPIVIGALGTVSNRFHLYLNKVRLDGSMQPLQRAFRSLGTARNYYKKTDGWE